MLPAHTPPVAKPELLISGWAVPEDGACGGWWAITEIWERLIAASLRYGDSILDSLLKEYGLYVSEGETAGRCIEGEDSIRSYTRSRNMKM